MSSPRLAIIGAGTMTANSHLPALMRLRDEGRCTLVGIADINRDAASRLAGIAGIPVVEHEAELLIGRDDVDAVCIFAPADVHYRLGLLALARGKHLFVEKPPAQHSGQLLEMIAAAKKHNRIAVAGLNRRFQSAIRTIKERLPSDAITTAEAVFHKPSAGLSAPFGMKSWLGANSIHALDVLCFVMGGPPSALWSAGNGDADMENFSALIEWNGRYAVFAANNTAGSRDERYAFHALGVSYVVQGDALSVYRDKGLEERMDRGAGKGGGIYEEFGAFLDAIESGEVPAHALESAAAALRLVELIEAGHKGPIDWEPAKHEPHGSVRESSSVTGTRVSKPGLLVLNAEGMKKELPMLAEHFRLVYADTEEEEARRSVRGVITGVGGEPLSEQHFNRFPNIAIAAIVGASVHRLGAAHALNRGIGIINASDAYAEAVAEFILMQALVGLRRASVSHDAMRRGGWGFTSPPLSERFMQVVVALGRSILPKLIKDRLRGAMPARSGTSRPTSRLLCGRTVGMIGWGEITKKAIPLFHALGARVLVHSEHVEDAVLRSLHAEKATLREVLAADVVSLQRGLSERTRKSFGTQQIESLRPGAVFINAARAGLVDTEALVARLKRGDIFAALDVYDIEPPGRRDPIRRLANVFLTAHMAGSIHHTAGLAEKARARTVEKLVAFFNGETIDAIRTPEQLRNMT